MIGYPVILSTSFSVQGLTIVPANPQAFYCPYRAMLVEEFRFACDDPSPHKMTLKAGMSIITEGLQPWSAMFPIIESNVFGVGKGAGNSRIEVGASNWLLPRPLYLPLQKQIAITMRLNRTPTDLTRALFAVRGRVLPEEYARPAKVSIPWVGVFRPASVRLNVADTTTNPLKSVGEFQNQFKTPLHIQKFIGMSSDEQGNNSDIESFGSQQNPIQYGVGRSLSLIQISDQHGNSVVRDATPLVHLCQGVRNEWNVDFDLAPGELLQATMDLRHPAYGSIATVWPSIAMVGWRDVPYEAVYG